MPSPDFAPFHPLPTEMQTQIWHSAALSDGPLIPFLSRDLSILIHVGMMFMSAEFAQDRDATGMTFWHIRRIMRRKLLTQEALLLALEVSDAPVAICRVSRETTLEVWKDIGRHIHPPMMAKLATDLRAALGRDDVLESLDSLLR